MKDDLRSRTKNQLTSVLAMLTNKKSNFDLAFALMDTAELCKAYADELDPRAVAHWEQYGTLIRVTRPKPA